MILTAHQPVYLPWLGLFHKIALADVFCIYDIVQYEKWGFNNRNKIKGVNGEILLTVPVLLKNREDSIIKNTKINNNIWYKKHFKAIEMNYIKSPYFHKYIEELKYIYMDIEHNNLTDLNTLMLKLFLKQLDIDTKIVRASDYNFVGNKSELALDMCIKLKTNKFIFGSEGENYADVESFQKNNIDIMFQNYIHPKYKQLYSKQGFLSHLSVLDLLFNEGENSKEILMSGNISKV